MVTRRQFLQGATSLALLGGRLGSPAAFVAAAARPEAVASGRAETAGRWARHVEVFTGTGGHGHAYPGATLPFGMVQLSPDALADRPPSFGGEASRVADASARASAFVISGPSVEATMATPA